MTHTSGDVLKSLPRIAAVAAGALSLFWQMPTAHSQCTSAPAITIGPATPQMNNTFPFGAGSGSGWMPYWVGIYKNVPAFDLQAGNKIRFDLGIANETDIQVDVALAAATTNGGTDHGPFTTIVTQGVPDNPRGDALQGNYELGFTVDTPFSFAGGGLLVRISNPGGAYATDATSTFNLVSGADTDTSGYFVQRVFGDTDGIAPWSSTGLTDIAAFQLDFNSNCDDFDGCTADVCDMSGVCTHTAYCSGTATSCGCTSCVDCNSQDGWYPVGTSYACCDAVTGSACSCQDEEFRDYDCSGIDCTFTVTAMNVLTSGCLSCDDSNQCTTDSCSSGVCSNLANSNTVSCYTGPLGTENVGECAPGTATCSGGTLGTCTGEVTPTTEQCDGFDNDCDASTDESPDVDPSCDDLDAGTTDYCLSGACQHDAICAGTETSCGTSTCQDCNLQDGFYDVGAPYACCNSTADGVCTCQDREERDYTCSANNCVYFVLSTTTVSSGCSSCNDGNACTVDTCDPATATCSNTNNGAYVEPCYTGPVGTEGIGACSGGTRSCTGGTLGACTNEVTPTAETCDAVDNDCNGFVDDGGADTECSALGQECWEGTCDDVCFSTGDCAAGEECYFENIAAAGRCAPVTDPCADVNCPGGSSCYNGTCSNTNCGNDVDCSVYSKCYNTGRCLTDETTKCNGVQCPQGDECVNGTCKKPCGLDTDCDALGGEKCYGGHCAVDPCSDVECQLGELCYQGNCYQQCGTNDDCSDPNDVCYDATRCAPATDPCAGVNCLSDEVCYQGSCYSDCSGTGTCADPLDACYDTTRCATDPCDSVQCPQFEACQGGVCYLQCTSDIDCSAISTSHACYGGFCKTGPCDGVQCAAGEVCNGGVCYVSCTGDLECQMLDPSHLCYGGLCTNDPCAGVLCGVAETCYQGSCYQYCDAAVACSDPSDVCWDTNVCETDLCLTVTCPSGQACYQGSCYQSCGTDADCTLDPSHACYDGRCASDPCDAVHCPLGEICAQGTCYQYCDGMTQCSDPNDICYNNTCRATPCDGVVCPSGEMCVDGTCYQSCTGSADCSDPTHICYNSLCQDPCDTTTCGAFETCYLGTCYEYCDGADPCLDPGHVCYDNRCVDAEDPWCDGVMCPTGESCYRGTCYNDCNSQADCDALPYDSVCYQNKCLPSDCSGTICDTGEVCYNGACYEDCSGGLQCSDPNMACFDNRCARSACEAQADVFLTDYNDNHLFHQFGKRLFAWQNSTPYLWPRPFQSPGDGFLTWADLGSGAQSSSNNDALYAKGAARVLVYFDDQDSNNYILYLIQGSKDAAQGATEATYGIRTRNVTPELIAMDDPDAEAYRVANKGSGNWTYTQVDVTTGPGETGGIALGKFNSASSGWKIEISAQFSGDIDRWEIMNGESGEPIRELNVRDVLILENKDMPGSEKIQPDFGITQCDTDLMGACKPGLVNACVNAQLQCVPTVGPWGFEICDGLDNNCNGSIDAGDPDLKYPIVESRQSLLFGGWRPWPTTDSYQTINDFMAYTPRSADDREGSTDVKRADGTSLQRPETVYMVMHRHIPTGQFSMPILVGARSSDSEAIDDFGDSDFSMDVKPQPFTSSSIQDLWVCWYDDREPGPTSDRVPSSYDSSADDMSLYFEVEEDGGWVESDSAVLRPNWHEAWSGRRSAYGVRFDNDDDDDEERLWRRYSPQVGDLTLTKWLRFYFRIVGTGPDASYCIADAPTPNGCRIGVYQCTPSGIACGPADDAICAGACGFDSDGDGHTLFDPAFCPDGTDCDDYDAETYLGAPEMCNGRDNDCDGFVDHQSKQVQPDDSVIDLSPAVGPEDCNGKFVCTCPSGEREEVTDPQDKCICSEN